MTRTFGFVQPEDEQSRVLLAQLSDSVGRLEKHIESVDTAIRGNGGDGVLTRLSHVERTCAELRESQPKPEADKTTQVRWQAIGQIAVAAAAATSLILQLL